MLDNKDDSVKPLKKFYVATGNVQVIRMGHDPLTTAVDYFKNIDQEAQKMKEKGSDMIVGTITRINQTGFGEPGNEYACPEDVTCVLSTSLILEAAGVSDRIKWS